VTAQAADKPLENLKPRRGMLVVLAETPGVWQILDPAPPIRGERPPGSWWLTPWDDDARAADPHPSLGSYRCATYKTMKPASTAGVPNR
jgi:hypothetical protein